MFSFHPLKWLVVVMFTCDQRVVVSLQMKFLDQIHKTVLISKNDICTSITRSYTKVYYVKYGAKIAGRIKIASHMEESQCMAMHCHHYGIQMEN